MGSDYIIDVWVGSARFAIDCTETHTAYIIERYGTSQIVPAQVWRDALEAAKAERSAS